jgi:plasmid maintenance system antidote protein VapI
MGLSQSELARALRLARCFGVSEGLFLGLQTAFNLRERRRQLGAILESIDPRAA